MLILNKLLKNYKKIPHKTHFFFINIFLLQSIEAGQKFNSAVLYKNEIDCNFSGIVSAEKLKKSQKNGE